MSISLDGFVSDLEGRNTWMLGSDQDAKTWSVNYLSQAGLHIMGSRTFLDMAAWWPTSTDAFAPPMNEIPKAVFSQNGEEIVARANEAASARAANAEPLTLQPGAESWASPYVASSDLVEDIAALKAQDDKPIIAHGGVRFARSLVAHGLVDQFTLFVVPVALGNGHALFSDISEPLRLELVSSRAFPGGGMAQNYRPL